MIFDHIFEDPQMNILNIIISILMHGHIFFLREDSEM